MWRQSFLLSQGWLYVLHYDDEEEEGDQDEEGGEPLVTGFTTG